jgi:hypothetical protein
LDALVVEAVERVNSGQPTLIAASGDDAGSGAAAVTGAEVKKGTSKEAVELVNSCRPTLNAASAEGAVSQPNKRPAAAAALAKARLKKSRSEMDCGGLGKSHGLPHPPEPKAAFLAGAGVKKSRREVGSESLGGSNSSETAVVAEAQVKKSKSEVKGAGLGDSNDLLRPPEPTVAAAFAEAEVERSGSAVNGAGHGDKNCLPRRGQPGSSADWGFEWHRAICSRLDAAAGGGVRRKNLRRNVLREYLCHLSERHEASGDRAWWEAHPTELKALFRSHLRRTKRIGQLRTQGKMVCRRQRANGS